MKLEEKEILRKKRVLEYAEACGNVLKTCRHFGVSRSNFYIWRAAYRRQGDAGLDDHGEPVRTPRAQVRHRASHFQRCVQTIAWHLSQGLGARYPG